MWLSGTAQNALRAVLHLAEHGGEGPVRVDDIAAELGLPRNYLSKTLHTLARAGVLLSTRGRGGGFQLPGDPADLRLERIILPFHPAGARRCLVGRERCHDGDPCPAHHRWSGVAVGVERFFAETTVADLLRRPAPRSPAPTPPSSEEVPHVVPPRTR